ncbi:hypothetical protein LWI28_024490 [Acer negundo]|uniref:Uncharacterized protein n=1 Tax=Acer negundo TaxID=4023 RepID=A0AAD5JG80_ACENE|nr:hypothetical protein LWI28_024490 [Acer negundo]
MSTIRLLLGLEANQYWRKLSVLVGNLGHFSTRLLGGGYTLTKAAQRIMQGSLQSGHWRIMVEFSKVIRIPRVIHRVSLYVLQLVGTTPEHCFNQVGAFPVKSKDPVGSFSCVLGYLPKNQVSLFEVMDPHSLVEVSGYLTLVYCYSFNDLALFILK